jgi:tetratricopeptide (TPR) repeat protein
MRYLLFIFFCWFSLQIKAQEPQLAFQYFNNGEYEKATAIFKPLHEKNPYNSIYLTYLIDCYQQLKQFDKVNTVVIKQIENFKNQQYLFIEIGYNFQLQHQQEKAEENYQKALNAINQMPSLG